MPSLVQLRSPAGDASLDLRSLPKAAIDGLYVHIPFCAHKCHYCDFYSITRQTEDRMAAFVQRLVREAQLWTERFPHAIAPRTIFFGGGTPTLLPVDRMDDLLTQLCSVLDLSAVDEWTIEANPATVTAEYCNMMRGHGVNRLSFGAQSFNERELAMLERHHNPDDVPRSVEIARTAGFDRLNLDLIYAIPGQSLDSWAASLDYAISLGTTHLSCYGLTYEPNTPMAVKKRLGAFTPAEESLEIQMMHHTRARLRSAGLNAYEISNYATLGEECRHNLMYWHGGNYMALGASGSSHINGVRWKNRPHLGEWETAIDAGEMAASDVECLSAGTRCGELAMLMLRLDAGLTFADFTARTGQDAQSLFSDIVHQLTPVGLLEADDQAIRITDKGLAVADAIASQFLATASDSII
jgi:oxygen-independent coproporphyrinogen-3 oxidase